MNNKDNRVAHEFKGPGRLYILDESVDFNPAAPTVEDLERATHISCAEISGYSLEAGDPVTVYPSTNYEAQMTFEREFIWASWGVDDTRLRAKVLGQFVYTPQDELRDRLNDGLRKKKPAFVTNTRYWRGL